MTGCHVELRGNQMKQSPTMKQIQACPGLSASSGLLVHQPTRRKTEVA